MRVHKEHRIECTPQRFFELMFDPEVERRMSIEGMGNQDLQLLERSVDRSPWRMRCRITPRDNLPGFVRKLVGAVFTLEEERTYQPGTDQAQGTMTPSALRDKVRMVYTLRLVPEGHGACRRIMDWEVEVRLFGVGGSIEQFAAAEIERGLDASARFLNQLLRTQTA
ncbi:MAG: DUF2505 domain-containing protein [Myxococcales bacterium]|nr:DUF2505 domain-containing protein [Myxococcota bacterium]MDW8281527.1 DUF2505 domain-containing protein [Myxococcales bacterium]